MDTLQCDFSESSPAWTRRRRQFLRVLGVESSLTGLRRRSRAYGANPLRENAFSAEAT